MGEGMAEDQEAKDDRVAFILLQASLALNGVQSRGKAAEIARISYEDMHELMEKMREVLP